MSGAYSLVRNPLPLWPATVTVTYILLYVNITSINIQQKYTCTIYDLFIYSFKDVLKGITLMKKTTIDFMQKHNILLSSVHCPRPLIQGRRQGGCGQLMHLKETNDSKDVFQWRCRKVHTVTKNNMKYKVKDVKVSIQYNSWLINSKLPLETVLEFIYLWSQGFTHSEVMHELKLSKKTVTEWFMFFREACMYCVIDRSEPIGGNRVEVEINESKFGKRKYHKGHRIEGQWVFRGREKYNKRKKLIVSVNNRKAATLLPLIKKWILPGSIIHSDCWKAYSQLEKMGYTHVTVNHSKRIHQQILRSVHKFHQE